MIIILITIQVDVVWRFAVMGFMFLSFRRIVAVLLEESSIFW